jgi:hypothetical protein
MRDAKIYQNVSHAQFSALAAKAQENGIAITDDKGSAKKLGVEVAWDYNDVTLTLSLQVLHTPIFVSAETVEDKLAEMVVNA